MIKNKVFIILLVSVLLIGSAVAGTSLFLKNFNDIGVDVLLQDIEVNGESFNSVFWIVKNNGNTEVQVRAAHGYSKYDFNEEEWEIVQRDVIEQTLAPLNEPFDVWGVGIGNLDLDSGYYMFWVEYEERDLIKENNVAREFVWID